MMEYKFLDRPSNLIEQEINELAEEGWKPIAMAPAGATDINVYVLLERKR